MELLHEGEIVSPLYAVPLIIFMLWLAPQAVGSKPFFIDLFEENHKARKRRAAEAQELS